MDIMVVFSGPFALKIGYLINVMSGVKTAVVA